MRGQRYDDFIDAYVNAATKLFPNALLHWEDFGPSNARRILDRYRGRVCTFNDDMQGTGAITLAAVLSAVRVARSRMRDQRVVIFGAGTAGVGIADLRDFQTAYARPAGEVSGWAHDGRIGLMEVVSDVKPTEAMPSELIAWTDGRGLIATGIPVPPVTYKGVTYAIGQANNALFSPGLGLGAIVSKARRISDEMFHAGADAVARMVDVGTPGASLLPQVENLREVSAAVAVADQAARENLARADLTDTAAQVDQEMWQQRYRPIRAA